jgi:hypothetical protein
MSPINPSNSAAGVSGIANMISDVFTRLDGGGDASTSMTKYSKTTAVVSRVYIEDSVAAEDIAVPLMAALNNIYIGYTLTTLQLANVVGSYSVVRNAISRVATESFSPAKDIIEAEFGRTIVKKSVPAMEAEVIEIDKRVTALAAGKVINFDFIVGQDKDGKPMTVEVPIHVNLMPTAVTQSVAEAFLSMNFEPSFTQRWAMYKAGELSLFKDILLGRDLVDKFSKAIKEDNSNVLKDMMNTKNEARGRQIKSVLTGRPNNNIASSIIIFDKKTFDAVAHTNNFDFTKYTDRQRFFDASLAMLAVVVDSNFNTVDIYYNGLQQSSSMSFRMIEKSGATKDSGVDIKTLMQTLSKGNAPKF